MKIIDAVWEKRNLGVSCYELRLESKDSLQEVKNIYSDLQEKQYMVVRIPSTRYDLANFFQQQEYVFIEAAITLEHNLKEITIPDRLMRICSKCSWEQMNDGDLTQLSSEIFKNIFKTDRVFIDPHFTAQKAAQRYDFWIKDLIRQGNTPYKVVYENETVGFFLNKKIDNESYDGLLAAAYSAYEGSGMGYCIQYAGIKSAMDKGAHKYIGHISANNPSVMKVLMSIGFSLKDIEYIFIKHGKGEQ